jgi:hypothetical protein
LIVTGLFGSGVTSVCVSVKVFELQHLRNPAVLTAHPVVTTVGFPAKLKFVNFVDGTFPMSALLTPSVPDVPDIHEIFSEY